MDLLALIFPPYRMLLPREECQSRRFRSHSFGAVNLPTTSSHGERGGHQPRLPGLEDIKKPHGYDDVTFQPKTLIPPTYCEPVNPTRQTVETFASLTEQDARDALIRYAGERCCYHMGDIKYMKIKEINMFSTFHYALETFTEKRQVVWCYEPYGGEAVDLAKNGSPPALWDIMQTPTEQFQDGMWQTEIPYTASILRCRECNGTGKEKCPTCQAAIEVACAWCDEWEKSSNGDVCTYCDGRGREVCKDCNFAGQIPCCTCHGKRKLKFYVKLLTTWTNHKDEFVNQETPLPAELLRGEVEQVVFQEEKTRVGRIDHFPQHSVKEASERLISEHAQSFPTERVLQQRQEVRIVPVARVKYIWRDKTGEFFVYGSGNKVYFPEYPQSCCCRCVVI